MIRLYGIPVAEPDAHALVDLLLRVGRADDLKLASKIDYAVELKMKMLSLSALERDTLLHVLDDPPDRLGELRGVLARDQRERQQ